MTEKELGLNMVKKEWQQGSYKIIAYGKKIIALTTGVRGEICRGIATCSPEDSYNLDFGVSLAIARCELKKLKNYYSYKEEIIAKNHQLYIELTDTLWKDTLISYNLSKEIEKKKDKIDKLISSLGE